jgi:hypothetical protein
LENLHFAISLDNFVLDDERQDEEDPKILLARFAGAHHFFRSSSSRISASGRPDSLARRRSSSMLTKGDCVAISASAGISSSRIWFVAVSIEAIARPFIESCIANGTPAVMLWS